MRTFEAAIVGALAKVSLASVIKFGVLTDLHLQPYYDETKPAAPDFCCSNVVDSDLKTTEEEGDSINIAKAYFGRLGCDPPARLVEMMMDKMSSENQELQVILVNGDHVGHGIALESW